MQQGLLLLLCISVDLFDTLLDMEHSTMWHYWKHYATLCEFHSTSGDKKVCFLCEASVDVKFEPCGHALMCRNCADRAKKCPLCKVCSLCVHYYGQEF